MLTLQIVRRVAVKIVVACRAKWSKATCSTRWCSRESWIGLRKSYGTGSPCARRGARGPELPPREPGREGRALTSRPIGARGPFVRELGELVPAAGPAGGETGSPLGQRTAVTG